MDRRRFLGGTAATAAWLVCGTPLARITIHEHDRLRDVWGVMAHTGGGPALMRAAVEREFGNGFLRFIDRRGDYPVVLFDTASIDFWKIDGYQLRTHATAQVMIIGGGLPRSNQWMNGAVIRCDGSGQFG